MIYVITKYVSDESSIWMRYYYFILRGSWRGKFVWQHTCQLLMSVSNLLQTALWDTRNAPTFQTTHTLHITHMLRLSGYLGFRHLTPVAPREARGRDPTWLYLPLCRTCVSWFSFDSCCDQAGLVKILMQISNSQLLLALSYNVLCTNFSSAYRVGSKEWFMAWKLQIDEWNSHSHVDFCTSTARSSPYFCWWNLIEDDKPLFLLEDLPYPRLKLRVFTFQGKFLFRNY